MSAKKKSFDIKAGSKKKPAPKITKSDIRRAPRENTRRESLRDKRSREGRLVLILFVVALLLVVGATVYGLWQEEVRIKEVYGPDAYQNSIVSIGKEHLAGTYLAVIPRDSVFFYPEQELRQAILDAHPEVAAVSIRRSGFTELTVSLVLRTTAFWWCGTPDTASAEDGSCFKADVEGFIFAPVPALDLGSTTATSSIPSGTTLRLYAEIDSASTTESWPLRAKMKDLEELPSVLKFVKELRTLAVVPVSLAVRADEVDLFIEGGTRITYVIGKEEEALRLAASVFPELPVHDGSILYLDLRFPDKVYLKRRGE